MLPDQAKPEMRRCARCGQPVRPDRLVKGFGRGCAEFLGLTGGTIDVGQDGPDLLDLLRTQAEKATEVAVQPS